MIFPETNHVLLLMSRRLLQHLGTSTAHTSAKKTLEYIGEYTNFLLVILPIYPVVQPPHQLPLQHWMQEDTEHAIRRCNQAVMFDELDENVLDLHDTYKCNVFVLYCFYSKWFSWLHICTPTCMLRAENQQLYETHPSAHVNTSV